MAEDMYHFEGCLEKFKKQIVNNKELVIWVSIAALLSLVRIKFIILNLFNLAYSKVKIKRDKRTLLAKLI